MSVDVPPPRGRTRNADSVRRNSHNHYLRNVSYRQARKALQRAGIDPDTRPEINVLAGRGVVADWRTLVGIPSRRPVSKTVDAEGSERARHAPHAEAPRQAAQEPPAFDPWALPSPPDAPQHIGHALRVEFVPAEAITLESTRLLHGAITRALRQPHSRTHPRWSLAPQGRGWAAVFCERELADAVRGQRFPAHMDGLPNSLVFHAQVVRPRAPAPLPAGRYLVTIDTLTPIAWRRMKRTAWRLRTTLKPTPETITNSLHRIVSVLGIDCHVSARAVARVESRLQAVQIHVGGHWGNGANGARAGYIRGVEGTITVECNAVTAWLLACTHVLGFGSTTALGFGRVHVRVARAG